MSNDSSEIVLFKCNLCAFTSENCGACATHEAACKRKADFMRKRDEECEATVLREEELLADYDDHGRKLWKTKHNAYCELCHMGGLLVLCSYCNLAFHLNHHMPILTDVPPGIWMCGPCVGAEQAGEDMTTHGDLAGVGAGDANANEIPHDDGDDGEGNEDEDTNTDLSEAIYKKHGIAPIPADIWDASTAQALQRALHPEHVLPVADTLQPLDHILNRIKSRFKCSASLMVAFDEVLIFQHEHPDEKFTPARERQKVLTAHIQETRPEVTLEVCSKN